MLCTEIEIQPKALVLDGAICPDTQSLSKVKVICVESFDGEIITPSLQFKSGTTV